MSNKNYISIEGNGNILLQDIKGRNININDISIIKKEFKKAHDKYLKDIAFEIDEKFNDFQNANKQQVENLFKVLNEEIVSKKIEIKDSENVNFGNISGISGNLHIGHIYNYYNKDKTVNGKSFFKVKFNSISTERWSNYFFLDFSLVNTGKELIIVNNIYVEVVDIIDLLKIKSKENGAPAIQIKGVVKLENKIDKYKIVFKYNNKIIKQFSYKENDLDNMYVKVKGVNGYIYKCKVLVEYVFATDINTTHMISSELFSIKYPYTTATEILSRL